MIFLKISSDCVCKLLNNMIFKSVYCSIISPSIFHLIPQLTVLVLNVFLVREMVKYFRNTSKMCIDYIHASPILKTKDHHHSNSSRNKLKMSSNNLHIPQSLRNSEKSIDKLSEKRPRYSKHQIHTLSNHSNNHFYILILISSLWSFLTIVPYYSFQTYFSLNQLKFFESNFDQNIIFRIKVIASTFFNSNHCFNFFIYVLFHHEFRDCFKSFFLKIHCRTVSFQDNIVEI